MLKLSAFLKLARFHPRLLVSALVGLLVGLGARMELSALQCTVIGWDVFVWLYLIMIWVLMARADAKEVREFAEQEDESATMVLMLVCVSASASLFAIILQLAGAKDLEGTEQVLHYVSTVATVLGSWFLVGTIFAVHYTRLFYNADDEPPLKFPGDTAQPDYWDFMYFSFTLSAAVQTSDVAIQQTAMRKVVLAHTVMGFLFNAVILGLSINIAASLIS